MTTLLIAGVIIVNLDNNLHFLLLQPAYEYDTFQLLFTNVSIVQMRAIIISSTTYTI